MDRKNLHLVIISPERTLFDGPVNWVELPGELGKFQVLVNHAPIISSLRMVKWSISVARHITGCREIRKD